MLAGQIAKFSLSLQCITSLCAHFRPFRHCKAFCGFPTEVLLRSRFVSCRQLVITFYQSCQGFNPFVAAESRYLITRICKCHCIDMSCAALWYCLSSCIAVASKYSSLLIQSILWNSVSSWLVMIIWGIRFSIDQNSCQTGL